MRKINDNNNWNNKAHAQAPIPQQRLEHQREWCNGATGLKLKQLKQTHTHTHTQKAC